jgi:hypothetical protein
VKGMLETKKSADTLIEFINGSIGKVDPEQEMLMREFIHGVFRDGYQACLNDRAEGLIK